MPRTPAGTPPHPKGAERFNEERATYALKGTAQPDIEAGVAAIREVVRTLKPKPGVYRMLDARGEVLYVGKARALKNRVANYCQVSALSGRLQRMVSLTKRVEPHYSFQKTAVQFTVSPLPPLDGEGFRLHILLIKRAHR